MAAMVDSGKPHEPSRDPGNIASGDALPPRKSGTPRGVLNLGAGLKAFEVVRYHPSDDLAFCVEHYWIVRWDLLGQEPFRQETLPHPSIHIALEPGRFEVYGVVEGRFIRVLEGRGRVFGIMFRPGGFHSFYRRPVSELTNRIIPLPELFGETGQLLGAAIATSDDDKRGIAMAEEFLRAQRPAPDENLSLVGRIVKQIVEEPGITHVEHLLANVDISKRTLQRLFDRYVGVGPKWVIQRYRLHEAIDRIAPHQPVEWANLAIDLGYHDQAHFIKHFKTIVGRTPEDYARNLQ
jgi:AraC-like DNA-binding protein